MPEFDINHSGIPVIYTRSNTDIAHFILHFPVGSRDEKPDHFGLMHLLEHMLFKGTLNKNYFELINSIENFGADINAYTTKENLVIFVSFPDRFLEKITPLLAEIVYESVFPENELKKEKNVIADEIRAYRDSAADFMYDNFEVKFFRNHALGHDILGSIKSMSSISSADLKNCMSQLQNHLHISVVSPRKPVDIFNIINRYFHSEYAEFNHEYQKPDFRSFNKIIFDDVSQSHYICGSLCSSYHSDDRQALMLLGSILGGQHLSAKLNMELREKHGLAYTVESSLSSFRDCGLLYHYFTCDHKRLPKAIKLMNNVFATIIDRKMNEDELHSAKRILKSQLQLYFEYPLNRALFHAKYYQYHKKIISTKDWVQSFDIIDAETIQKLSEQHLASVSLSSLYMKKNTK
ncbi:MAG: hypothetical protein C0592_09570 [Marinilabiliales bacterium]|nr:MAG: hypothetical protein C0592_09570 [Marinilabiliales bacterium]